jgi:hypothetical protein
MSAYVSIRQHTSAYVSIRQRMLHVMRVEACQRHLHTSAYVSIRQRMLYVMRIEACQSHLPARSTLPTTAARHFVSICTFADVSIRTLVPVKRVN